MSLPDPTAPIIEDYEVRARKTSQEENEKADKIAEDFIYSPEHDALKDALGEEGNNILQRIISQYSTNGENLNKAIADTINLHAKPLGYNFENPIQMIHELQSVVDPSNQEQKTINADTVNSNNPELYNDITPSGRIHLRMADRAGEGGADLLEEKLYTQEGRENNALQANTLFFQEGSDFLEGQFKNAGESSGADNTQKNKDWFEVNTKNNGPLEDSFTRIQENFILPDIPGYDGSQSLSELIQSHPNEKDTINQALSDAFLLEIEEVTLKGALNYDHLKVELLKQKIFDPSTMPLEKLMAFGEIHTSVSTAEGRGGRRAEEAFRLKIKSRAAGNQKTLDFIESIQEQIRDAQSAQEKGILEKKLQAAEIIKNEGAEESSGDLGVDWDLAFETGQSESGNTTKETA